MYESKRQEATHWQAVIAGRGTPSAEEHPWLMARATRRGVSPQEVADEWSAKAAAWAVIGRAIEDAYEAAVEAVDAVSVSGTAEAEIAAIIDAVVWP